MNQEWGVDFLVIKSYNDIIIWNFKLKGERNVYKNLMAELAKREMSLEELSKEMGIKQEMLLLKMENRHGINFKEAVKIKTILKTDMPLEKLFFLGVNLKFRIIWLGHFVYMLLQYVTAYTWREIRKLFY